ncbi:MAG: glycine C-acetyltransferase [Candidatus Diapherotrites archaeon]|nr:glycine C-acetyltransferase [Candidatus Diapherotrites archaeon]
MAGEEFFSNTMKDLREKKLEWTLKSLETASGARGTVEGKKVIIFCSNNYLGLSNHPALKKAAIEAVKKYGAGSGSVRGIAGTMDLHLKLEKEIAKFKGTEAATYYQTGFAVNAGMIPAMMLEGDLIISDELNHGSIIDGMRLSKAERMVFGHKDMEKLKALLEESDKKNYGKKLVVTDGVFSMDGDIAPLDKIERTAHEHNAMVYVDDAHGDGVLGAKGKGIVHHFHLQNKIEFEMGTFSKAFGVMGGYVCGKKEICDFAYNKSRTWLLSGSSPPATVAACIASLKLLEKNESFVKKLWKNTAYFKQKLKALGFDTGQSETPITPIMLGESATAVQFSQNLFREGVFALPILFPMVARDKARIRTMVSAAHSKEDLDEALGKFEKIGKELKVLA